MNPDYGYGREYRVNMPYVLLALAAGDEDAALDHMVEAAGLDDDPEPARDEEDER